ncbi:uba ts-n domain-containing protein [Cyclospora cayetanensis]|uniref:Uba ts-n domain-containing protein n=1 Tax=Cyclospora cayetanensis TaxID=88456 RepID=A0A1D3CYR5_9EIME|nr:uba ts-n domain-containing protein [Cyclospora cayetanensis]
MGFPRSDAQRALEAAAGRGVEVAMDLLLDMQRRDAASGTRDDSNRSNSNSVGSESSGGNPAAFAADAAEPQSAPPPPTEEQERGGAGSSSSSSLPAAGLPAADDTAVSRRDGSSPLPPEMMHACGSLGRAVEESTAGSSSSVTEQRENPLARAAECLREELSAIPEGPLPSGLVRAALERASYAAPSLPLCRSSLQLAGDGELRWSCGMLREQLQRRSAAVSPPPPRELVHALQRIASANSLHALAAAAASQEGPAAKGEEYPTEHTRCHGVGGSSAKIRRGDAALPAEAGGLWRRRLLHGHFSDAFALALGALLRRRLLSDIIATACVSPLGVPGLLEMLVLRLVSLRAVGQHILKVDCTLLGRRNPFAPGIGRGISNSSERQRAVGVYVCMRAQQQLYCCSFFLAHLLHRRLCWKRLLQQSAEAALLQCEPGSGSAAAAAAAAVHPMSLFTALLCSFTASNSHVTASAAAAGGSEALLSDAKGWYLYPEMLDAAGEASGSPGGAACAGGCKASALLPVPGWCLLNLPPSPYLSVQELRVAAAVPNSIVSAAAAAGATTNASLGSPLQAAVGNSQQRSMGAPKGFRPAWGSSSNRSDIASSTGSAEGDHLEEELLRSFPASEQRQVIAACLDLLLLFPAVDGDMVLAVLQLLRHDPLCVT